MDTGRLVAGGIAIVTATMLWPAVAASPAQPKMRRISAVVEVKEVKKKTHVAPPAPRAIAIAAAKAQLGKPYRWAGMGPNTFDCSGLTLFAYGKAGVSLPHNSGAQFSSVKRVPLDKMRPGDLVFSGYSRIGHVGIYIGGGKMIHSPHSGRNVEIAPVHGNLIGAGRPTW